MGVPHPHNTRFIADDVPQDDLDHSGASQKVGLPAVDDVMAAVLNTTASWKKERVQPIPVTLAQQKGEVRVRVRGEVRRAARAVSHGRRASGA